MRTHLIRILAVGLSALLSACAASPGGEQPLTLPPWTVGSKPHVGSALTGPLAIAASASSASPLVVHYRAVWVESSVPTTESLEPHVGLVLGLGDAEPVRPLSRRAGKLGFARGPDAERLLVDLGSGALGRTTTVWDEVTALGSETTLRLDVASSGPRDEIDSFTLESTRAADADSARIALQIGSRLDATQELLVLRDPLRAAEGPIALVFRREAQRDEPAALVVLVEIGDGVAPPRMSPLAEGDIEASVADAAERRREFTRAEAERREIQDVAAQLGSAPERRARLVFLASSCGAPLALDVALIARESDLKELAEIVQVELERPLNRADAGWRMERSAWLLLGQKSASGSIAPELSGILTRHGGEAARFPGAIEDLVRGEVSVAGLAKKLTAENRILLEDASPASRLRAYDWLAVRGLAPAGFDPFGTLAERRAALLAAAEAEEAAATRATEAQR